MNLFYSPRPGEQGFRKTETTEVVGGIINKRKMTSEEKKEWKSLRRKIRKLKRLGKPVPPELLQQLNAPKDTLKEAKVKEEVKVEQAKKDEKRLKRGMRRKGGL